MLTLLCGFDYQFHFNKSIYVAIIKSLPLFEKRTHMSLMQLASSALVNSQSLYAPESLALANDTKFADLSNSRYTALNTSTWYFLHEKSPAAAVSANILRYNKKYDELYKVLEYIHFTNFLQMLGIEHLSPLNYFKHFVAPKFSALSWKDEQEMMKMLKAEYSRLAYPDEVTQILATLPIRLSENSSRNCIKQLYDPRVRILQFLYPVNTFNLIILIF